MSNKSILLLSNYSSQFLSKELIKVFDSKNVHFEIIEADYNSIDFQILDDSSTIYDNEPNFIIWHESALTWKRIFYSYDNKDRINFVETFFNRLNSLISKLSTKFPNTEIIFPNFDFSFYDNVGGNIDYMDLHSWDYTIKKINFDLINFSQKFEFLKIIKSFPSNTKFHIYDNKLIDLADLHFSIDYLKWLSSRICTTINSSLGILKKCLILDLDNTLWGGVVGDDGHDGIKIGDYPGGRPFMNFQNWILEHKKRGVILCICSKNQEDAAKSAFTENENMLLKLEDISVFIANWENKHKNIETIQEILNISFDSLVFIDDNPAERDIVRKYLPDVLVPEIPKSPEDYVDYLTMLNIFEQPPFSNNLTDRTTHFQKESKRVKESMLFTNISDYLISLNMKGKINSFQDSDIDRVSELSLRSNQFNLTTIRYSVGDLKKIMTDKNYFTYQIKLSDKFGEYGLICCCIVKKEGENSFIESLYMSCRVLKRGVEKLLFNKIISDLRINNIKNLYAQYLPTKKNSLVKNLLKEFGMKENKSNNYSIEINNYKPFKVYIK